MIENVKGIYLLLIAVDSEKLCQVGNLSPYTFEGKYIYVGSARGPAGFGRIRRHLEVSSGSRKGGHWHIDSLTESGKIQEVWFIPTKKDLECHLVSELEKAFKQPIAGFGSSDCSCRSHLFVYEESRKEWLIKKLKEIVPKTKPIRFEWT